VRRARNQGASWCGVEYDAVAQEVVLLSENITRDFENLLKYFDEQAKWDSAKASNTFVESFLNSAKC